MEQMNKQQTKKYVSNLIKDCGTINLACNKLVDELRKKPPIDLHIKLEREVANLVRNQYIKPHSNTHFKKKYNDETHYIYDTKVIGCVSDKKQCFNQLYKCACIDFSEGHISPQKFIDVINGLLYDIDYITPMVFYDVNNRLYFTTKKLNQIEL